MSETDIVLGLGSVAGISGRRAYSLRGNGLVSDFMADRIEILGLVSSLIVLVLNPLLWRRSDG
jgi:hypothetical protein